ncbi:FAD-dependent oxidoreductase, partial [bacterium]
MQPDLRFLEDLTPTSNRVEPAEVLDNPDAAAWDESCDVLVVGIGMAGVCTALGAAEDPTLQVIAIDRGEGGGASKLSGGVVYMGGGTKAQREAGIEDTPENMANYLEYETGNVVRSDTVRRFAAASTQFQDWLEKYGARFGGPGTDAKTSYPEDASLYYSGNELTVPGRERATPAPRGHRAKPSKGGEPTTLSGSYLLPPLIQSMERRQNVRFLRQTRAIRMIVDRDGAIVGLEVKRIASPFARWRHAKLMKLINNLIVSTLGMGTKVQSSIAAIEAKARPLRIRVLKGVVLSAGGFTYNRAMMAKTAPDYLGSYPLGTIGDDGSGIKLGMTVGARTDLLDRISAWKFLYAPENWVKAVSIGPDGERL